MNASNSHPRPFATYRLQFNRGFRFDDARALVPYFSRLGVTHVYSSPLLRARAESTHGYDVVDPRTVNPNIGDETGLRTLVQTLHAHGLGLVLDIVPNHMAASGENPSWEHVLTYGTSSPYARWFDIDWRMPHPRLWGRVLVPILGEPLSRVLAQDQIAVFWDQGRFRVRYWDNTFPLDPSTVPMICEFGLGELREQLPPGHPALAEIETVVGELAALPRRMERMRRRVELPLETAEELLSQLAQTITMSPQVQDWAVRTAERFGEGREGQQRLRRLLDAQNYRLVFWRRAARILNYRRFFDINDLISVRQEDPEVFDETHALIARWIEEGLLDGLRIDHIDGLRDPLGYLKRLHEMIVKHDPHDRDLPVWVEKILAPEEQLPADWPSAGTTGYEALNDIEALLLSPEGYAAIEENYRRLLGRPTHFEQVANWGKRRILKADLSAFVGRLADILFRLAQQHPETAALRKRELIDAIVEFVVGLPCYRTYINSRGGDLSEHDRWAIERALGRAEATRRASAAGLNFLGEVLLNGRPELSEHEQQERFNFIERLQQLTGPATAKGVEDTALYAYVPLASRNEVGSDPDSDVSGAAGRMHEANRRRLERSPQAMICATTHDTKRSADVRARLDVLTECPKIWDARVHKWRQWNRPRRRRTGEKLAPDPNAEYVFYQSAVGIWPVTPNGAGGNSVPDAGELESLRERLEQYMLKAVREAKIRTSWTSGDADYEQALRDFVRSTLSGEDDESRAFIDDVTAFAHRLARPGFWNALARTLIQFTAPGTPDLYQGDELWNFSLVDPDNRRDVDYTQRQEILDDLVTRYETSPESRDALLAELVAQPEDGRIKLHVIRSALHARREHPDVFAAGDYQPLGAAGDRARHVFAYLRTHGDSAVLAAAPRLTTALVREPSQPPVGPEAWGDDTLPLPEPYQGRDWISAFTGQSISGAGEFQFAELFSPLPVALLISGPRG